MRANTINLLGASMHYTVYGHAGPAVVLLHGFGFDSRIWHSQIAALQASCRLLVPDLPGSGYSTIPAISDPNEAGNLFAEIDTYALLVKAMADAEKTGPLILLGHSMGGYITLAFVEKYPDAVQAYGLIHSTAYADSREKKEMRTRSIVLMEEFGAAAFLKNTIPNLFGQAFRKERPEQIKRLIREGASFSVSSLQQYYRAMRDRPDRTHVLAGNQHPVLFVLGAEDVAAPLNDLLQQVSVPPGISYIRLLPGIGHMSMCEAPETLNRQLLEFISFNTA
ncbi:MAG TPA: alpha/beta hydrolase [Sediminibacterium sp.]|nr:alpha/beta hydrolase [Sediminibacterium sp.]